MRAGGDLSPLARRSSDLITSTLSEVDGRLWSSLAFIFDFSLFT